MKLSSSQLACALFALIFVLAVPASSSNAGVKCDYNKRSLTVKVEISGDDNQGWTYFVGNEEDGPMAGDRLLWAGNYIYNGKNKKYKNGDESGSCDMLQRGVIKCYITLTFNKNDAIELNGFYDPDKMTTWAIVGGTGKYKTAQGEGTVQDLRNSGGRRTKQEVNRDLTNNKYDILWELDILYCA